MTVAELLGERHGLRIDGSTTARLARAVAEAAEAKGVDSGAYAARLLRDEAALEDLVERLTVQESAFFRHPAHFDVVAEQVAGAPAGVVWSAGCGNGQEAWSLAMLLEELAAPGWSVLGTDLSGGAVARTREGVYAERELRGLSPARRTRFLRRTATGDFEVAPALRGRVRVARHDLARDPLPLDFDGRVVLCRNVLIYLRPPDADAVLARLRDGMPAHGVLLIGAAETLPAGHPSFASERRGGVFVYRPRTSSPQPAPGAPPREPKRPAPPGRRDRLPAAADLVRTGERHAAAGRHREAAAAFRQAIYLTPGDALAHARLGFALEAAGDARAARRAFRAARLALSRMDPEAVAGALEGWPADTFARVVAERSGDTNSR